MAKAKSKNTKTSTSDGKLPLEERKVALDKAMNQIVKDFGKGSLIRLGDRANQNIETIPTGILTLDIALGIGGLPRGRIVEIYGQESSGKTTVTLHLIAEAQKMGGIAAFIDAEHALDPAYAKRIGVDTDNLLVSQPDSGEQALEITDSLVRSGAVDLIVVDSVAALVPQAEIEGAMGDASVGLHARLMSKALRKLTGNISRSQCICVFINQMRERIGAYMSQTTTGGRALKFYTSVRMEVKRGTSIGQSNDIQGSETYVKIVKNKVAPPFQTASFNLYFGRGVDNQDSIISLATDMQLLKKSGSWYSYEGQNLGQGLDKVKTYLTEHPELSELLEKQVREHYLSNKSEDHPTDTKAKVDSDEFTEEDILNFAELEEEDDEEDDLLDDLLSLDEI